MKRGENLLSPKLDSEVYVMYNYDLNKLIIIAGGENPSCCRVGSPENKRGVIMKRIIILAFLVFALFQTTFTLNAEIFDIDEFLAQKRAELEGTEWVVEMRPIEGGKTETDIISFYSGQVSSRNLTNQGFAPTSYSLRLEENGNIVWETAQTAVGEAKAFFRGDIIPDGMVSGVLSVDNGRGKTVNYNFAGSSVR